MLTGDGGRRLTRSILALTLLLPLLSSCGASTGQQGGDSAPPCTVPALAGTVVHVDLSDMAGGMMTGGGMGGSSQGMGGGHSASSMPMKLGVDKASVDGGQPVSFIAHNGGSIDHELVVIQLAAGTAAGSLTPGADRKADEGASRAEASKPCGSGPGKGLMPGATGWVTVTLQPGTYAVICNEPGHYTAGMWASMSVR